MYIVDIGNLRPFVLIVKKVYFHARYQKCNEKQMKKAEL